MKEEKILESRIEKLLSEIESYREKIQEAQDALAATELELNEELAHHMDADLPPWEDEAEAFAGPKSKFMIIRRDGEYSH